MPGTITPKLSASQVLLLQALAQLPEGAPGLTKEELKGRCGFAPSADTLGPGSKTMLAEHPDSLYGRGLVRPVQVGDDPVQWAATARGRKLAGTVKARRRVGAGCLAQLGPADLARVARLKDSRTYGFELYTAEDLRAVRELLPDGECRLADDDTLRQWLVNARKRGLFADRSAAVRKSVEKVLREFAPGGTVLDGLLTPEQVQRLLALVNGPAQ